MHRRTFLQSAGAAAIGLGSIKQARAVASSLPVFPDPKTGLKGSQAWSLAVIPDTQNYSKYGKNQANFHLMTEWLRDHAEAWKVQAVLQEGDLVEQNDIAEGGGRGYGDQNARSQWDCARSAMAKLDGVVPTIYATGNHDYGFRNSENRRTQFNSYFGLTDNPLTCDGRGGGVWRESGTNSFGAETLENAAYEITAPDGRRLLILSLEWAPRREAVAWGNSVLQQDRYRDHLGILLTHSFLTPKNVRDGRDDRPANPHTYPTGEDGNTHDGEELWKALVQPSRQIQLVLNGHEMGRHVGYRKDPGAADQIVHQMLFNAQGLGGGSREEGNGGDGWLRLLTFEPDGSTLTVRTFSPLKLKQGIDPWFRNPNWCFQVKLQGPA
jgi:hypothetical protein